MAGIGFVLRKLTRSDDLLGIVRGFAHSALASNGPWLFTILALASLSLLALRYSSATDLGEFRIIIIYNFCFSLVLTGPVVMVVTRTLADMIYEKDVTGAVGLLTGAMALITVVQLPLVIGFYCVYADLDWPVRLAAVGNFVLVSSLWLVAVFLSALKDYRSISASFAVGMLAAVVGGVLLGRHAGVAGMLYGFNAGIALILGLLVAKIMAEYPYPVLRPMAVVEKFRPYRALAASGLIYNLAIWSDKWVMWTAPEAELQRNGLLSYPHYDSAMFLAHLSIMPAMAAFMVVVETRFFEAYLKFYRDLQRHASFERININHAELVKVLTDGIRNLIILQGALSLFVILLAPNLFEHLGIEFAQMGIFRLGVLGSLFQVLVLVLFIVLAYFDFRTPVLALQSLFLVCNAGFTYLFMQQGFPYYGYGYFLATLVTFVAAYVVTYWHLRELPYQSFVRNNQAIRQSRL